MLPPRSPLTRRTFFATSSNLAAAAFLGEWLRCRPALAEKEARALRAGAARRIVTPPLHVPYLTSSGLGTNAPFRGVHDHLYARALVLDDGTQAIAVVAVDSIGYDNAILGAGRNFTAELRRRVAAETQLAPGAIMLAATHTHSAPETIGLTRLRDTPGAVEWLEEHLQVLAATVIEAFRRRVPASARFGKTKVTGVARNRRILMKDGSLNRRGPVPAESEMAAPQALDEELSLLYFETASGEALAALLNYTAHPVVTMLLPDVSADFPGAAASVIEEALSGITCLFTNGAAGNINSVKVSTSYEDAAAIGGKLGRAALAEIERLRKGSFIAHPGIHTHSQTITLEPRSCPSIAEAEQIASAKPIAANLRQLRLARKIAEGPIEAEIQVTQVGPIKWVSLPGEPFVEIGLAAKNAGASFLVGYANGYVGYL